jgi:hypothetical protein
VVRTFTRMALPSGRRNHFCLLALGLSHRAPARIRKEERHEQKLRSTPTRSAPLCIIPAGQMTRRSRARRRNHDQCDKF